MSLNTDFYKWPVVVASELFSSGWCNLDCKYCYIPKTDFLMDVHKVIIDKIKSGQFLDELKLLIGDDLESLSHWGTEPTLTFKHFKNFYNKAVELFPKLETIIFSSNFMTDPDKFVEFINELPEKLRVSIQISLDGPPQITDKNRRLGATDIIIDNIVKVFSELAKTERRIDAHFKPTMSMEDIFYFSDINNLGDYYKFFDELLDKIPLSSNISLATSVDPTIQVPGAYLVKHGIAFAKLYKNQLKLRVSRKYKNISAPQSNYFYRMLRVLNHKDVYYSRQRMFTCSAGDSSLAIGDRKLALHWCHRTFYTTHSEYFDNAKDKGILPDRLLANVLCEQVLEDKYYNLDIFKFLSKSRAFHDFTILRENNAYATILGLVNVGQLSTIYRDEQAARFLLLTARTSDCFIDALERYGSVTIPDPGLLRLFGNGYCELLLQQYLKEGFIR